MITKRAGNIGDALETFNQFRPGTTRLTQTRFAKHAGAHFGIDYSESRGLRAVGLNGKEVKNYVEFHQYDDDDKIEIVYHLAVKDDEGDWVVFDKSEALWYDTFIRQAHGVSEGMKEQRAIRENKRSEIITPILEAIEAEQDRQYLEDFGDNTCEG